MKYSSTPALKKSLITLLFLVYNLFTYGQTVDTVWLNTKWEKSAKEKASYFRIIKTSEHKTNYEVSDYYITGEIQMSGNYLSLDTPQVRHGSFTWWYRNGNKKAEHLYDNNQLQKEMEWDTDGKITNEGQYVKVWRMENGKEEQVLARIDRAPEFPGGMGEAYKFIKNNFNYSEDLNLRPRGKIIVSFTISSKGKVIQPKITQSLDPLLDQEAIRVISSMPKWTPGRENGKDVDVMMRLPISLD